MDMNIDWRLKRLEKRIKLKDIAKELNVSDSLLSQFESGKKNLKESLYKEYVDFIKEYEREGIENE